MLLPGSFTGSHRDENHYCCCASIGGNCSAGNEGGATERALELVFHSLQHPSSQPEVMDRAKQLRAELVAQLTPRQVAAVEDMARARTAERDLPCRSAVFIERNRVR